MTIWLFLKMFQPDCSCHTEGQLANVNENLPEEEHHQHQHQTSRCAGQPAKQGNVAHSVEQDQRNPLDVQLSIGKSELSKYYMKLTKHSYELYIYHKPYVS